MATIDGSIGRTPDLGSSSSLLSLDQFGYPITCSQWRLGGIFQLRSSTQTFGCCTVFDSLMEPSPPWYSPISRHVSKRKPTTAVVCWEDSFRTKENKNYSSTRYLSHCTGFPFMSYLSGSQCDLATNPRSRDRFPYQPFTYKFGCHYRGTILDPSFQRNAGSTYISISGYPICR